MLQDTAYTWNLKIQQTCECHKKKKQTHRCRKPTQLSVGRDGGEIWGGGGEVQTSECKTGSRMYRSTWGIRPLFCNL